MVPGFESLPLRLIKKKMKNTLRSFTLLELIVVIVILGILATLGFTQYSKQVESTRLAEAKVRIGNMRQLATEYYLKNGSLDGITNADVGADNTCTSSNFYRYWLGDKNSYALELIADRCTSGGKIPNASRRYSYYLRYFPGTGQISWGCYYDDDGSGCFGLSWLGYLNPEE
ncbi:MAG: type II secretion system protein [Candidatus Omnitrophica bacterium]|nr:type II secretion system protein [Candidatus Omnitrophota bacterium]